MIFFEFLDTTLNQNDLKLEISGETGDMSIYARNSPQYYNQTIKQYIDDMTVSCIDISNLISQLKCGKAAGSDDLRAEYFKFAHNKLHILLSMCFTLFLLIVIYLQQ